MAKVTQVDYDTGESIETYPTIAAAAEDNWLCRVKLAAKLRAGGGVAVYNRLKLKFLKGYD